MEKFVDKTFDPSAWTPYECVCQVDNGNIEPIWQDYATIKDEVDQKAALELVLSSSTFRVAETKSGVTTYYTVSPF